MGHLRQKIYKRGQRRFGRKSERKKKKGFRGKPWQYRKEGLKLKERWGSNGGPFVEGGWKKKTLTG